VKGIRRLFLPHVGARGPIKHLFGEFQNSLGDRREQYQEVSHERRLSPHSRLYEITRAARARGEFLGDELESLRALFCELLAKESCEAWLGFNDLARPDTKPRVGRLAGLVFDPELTETENMQKLRMYRAAAFADYLRPNVLDWETPRISDMEWVLRFIEVFTRPGISVEDQTVLIEDLSRPRVSLEKIVQTTRGPRLELSESELRYVWETKDLSHEERASAWDSRTPMPFQPFGRPNLEIYGDRKLRDAWRAAVNRQLDKAKAHYDPDADRDERELN
jgi:hypothetical protein